MTLKRLLFPVLAAAIFLSGCGGGSSGSGSGTGSGSTGGNGTGSGGSTGGGEAPVETVIRTGDIFAVSGYEPQRDLIAKAVAEIDEIEAYDTGLLRGLYGSSAISYAVGNRTSFVSFPSYERKRIGLIPILQTPDRAHAVAGTYRRQFGRFSLFGSAPPVLFNSGQNLGFEAPFRRLVAWLLGDAPGATTALAGNPTIVLARTHDTAILQAWFQSNLPNATVTVCSNDSELANCTGTAGLLVLGKTGQSARVAADTVEIDRLLRANKAVLYLHGGAEHESAGSDAYSALFGAVFPYAGNFFTSETNRNSAWPHVDQMIAAIAGDNNAIKTALNHIDRGDFSFDWNAGLTGNVVDPAAVPGYEENFGRAARAIRSGLNALDDRGISIFEQPVPDFRLSRILALVGDGLRQDVVFPMDILTSDQNAFLASYLADHMVYNLRRISPRQADRGFHGRRDHAAITPTNHSATINTRFHGRKPVGVYALPGKAFTVTRTDANSDVRVVLYMNVQSPGGTFEFRSGNRYDMPKYLRSQEIRLEPGKSLTLVSPYGGVIHVDHGQTSDPAKNIALSFSGVGRHPFYNGPASAATFVAGLAAGVYDWAEIVTPDTYVTEPLDLMNDTIDGMATRMGWDINEVARVSTKYYYNEMVRLMGHTGFDIPAQPAEVSSFCQANGWECANSAYHGMSGYVEGNARQSITNCGSGGGCSNQPVTYTWDWDPLGAGPVHERGHHLEGNSGASYHAFAPLDAHHLTNTWRAYLPYAYYRETGNTGACDVERDEHRGNGARFQILQNARNSGNVKQHMADNIWNSGQLGSMTRAMITQFAAQAANQGRFTDGWNYLPLMLIAAREFKQKLDEGEAAFDSAKSRYGFGQYTRAEALDMVATEDGQRSWALIAYSFITGRDQRNYFRMLGFDFTAKASSQVAANSGLLSVPAAEQFYAFDDICSIDNAIPVPVDGVTAWPAVRPTVF